VDALRLEDADTDFAAAIRSRARGARDRLAALGRGVLRSPARLRAASEAIDPVSKFLSGLVWDPRSSIAGD